jgi:uncharacterized membrane protein YphA (DoxX/SURF4 family)
MKIAIVIVRVLLGLMFVVFGSNGFLHFIKAEMPGGQAGAFAGAMFMSGYFYAVAATQFLGGLFLLIGRYVAVGLVLLGPVLVNILLFHICLTHGAGIGMGVFSSLLEVFLIYAYRERFAAIFRA